MDDFRRNIVKVGAVGTGAALLTGCETVAKGILMAGGLSKEKADQVVDGFTPEQEYYIGRTVSAGIFQKYKPYNNPEKLSYLYKVGMTLAFSSDAPVTYGGYHFAILDSDEINAFAAPGGFIFVTLGMLRCCPHEDALAAVLAHEIAHVQLKHGLESIKDNRVAEAIAMLAVKAASEASGDDHSKLIKNFEGSITDISTTMVNRKQSKVT